MGGQYASQKSESAFLAVSVGSDCRARKTRVQCVDWNAAPPSCNVPGIGFIILDRLSLTEYQHIECQCSSENPIYEGRKIVEFDLRLAQTRQKFANSSRIHEDLSPRS